MNKTSLHNEREKESSPDGLMLSVDGREKGEVSYQVLKDLSEVSAISEQWNALLDGTLCNRAFSSAQWYLGSCGVEEEARPYVIVARRGAALVGILPLVLNDDGDGVEFPSYVSDYNDIVAAPEDREVIAGLLDYLISPASGHRRITLSNLRDDSICLRALQAMSTARLFECSIQQDRSCFYLRLCGSFDESLRTKSRNFHKSLERARRRSESQDIRVRELDAGSFSPAQLPEIFLALNFERFGSGSHFSSLTAQAFVREVFPSLFMEGRLRAFALFKAEKIIGIDICMTGSNSLCTWNGGFKAEAEGCSPGKLLIGAGIERACALRLDEYDFLRGSHAYKARWANGSRILSRVMIRL